MSGEFGTPVNMYDHPRLMPLNMSCSAHILIPQTWTGLTEERLVGAMKTRSHVLLENQGGLIVRAAPGYVDGQSTF